MHFCKCLIAIALALPLLASDRINHEGRFLGDLPAVTQPILFNTPEADRVLSAMQIMPRESAWNEDISRRPLLPNSDAMIAQIIADLRSDRRTLRPFHEMNFVLIPDNQPLLPINFFNYADESDPSPYPIPSNLPVETWPRETGGLSLSDWQRDVNNEGGDRHSIVVMPGAGFIWETWLTRLNNGSWEASNGAKFDLKSNALRPAGWTSGDAAGLPMFPALVRYDECLRGMVEHAMRIVVRRSRLGPIYPATHHASVGSLTDPNIPAMGQRLRLKSAFAIPENWTIFEKAVLRGLQKYGAMVADNGNFFSISVTPDDRYPANAFSNLSSISITNFEVIQTTGPAEGPRASGAPRADAGPDAMAAPGVPVPLQGSVQADAPSLSLQADWKLSSGPTQPIFANPQSPNTTVILPVPGEYLLMLTASDGLHAPACDLVRVLVQSGPSLTVLHERGQVSLRFSGQPPFHLEQTTTLLPTSWTPIAEITTISWIPPLGGVSAFYRLRANAP